MYHIEIINEGQPSITIHEQTIGGKKISNGTINKEINAIDTFSFNISLDNVGYGHLRPYFTRVEVYNSLTNRYDFKGRVLEPIQSMDGNGSILSTYVCEGSAGYLHDSQQRYLEFKGSLADLLTTIIEYHNGQVEPYKRFIVGNVNMTQAIGKEPVVLSPEKTTWENIQSELVERFGGEIAIREEPTGLYIDYMTEVGGYSDTAIQLTKNLITNSKRVDVTNLVTRLTPLGASGEDTDSRLTIESVNGGLPYIDHPQLIAEFGIQGGVEVWDDVEKASELLSKGKSFLQKQKNIISNITLDALDLSLIDLNYETFKLGWYYRLQNFVLSIDETLRVVGMTLSIDNPERNSLTIGSKFKTLSEYQRESRESSKNIKSLQNRMKRMSIANTSLSNKLIQAQNDLISIQDSLTSVNIGNLPEELRVIGEQITELQNLLSNLDIPRYELATSVSDGLMSSLDKATVDTVGSASTLLTVDKTSVVASINELVARVQTLEGNVPIE